MSSTIITPFIKSFAWATNFYAPPSEAIPIERPTGIEHRLNLEASLSLLPPPSETIPFLTFFFPNECPPLVTPDEIDEKVLRQYFKDKKITIEEEQTAARIAITAHVAKYSQEFQGWETVRKCLSDIPPGILLCTGRERLLFTALLAPKGCLIVGRDIDPGVVHYLHFVVMLLKISENKNDFCELAEITKSQIDSRNEIEKRLEKSPHISPQMGAFYSENLQIFRAAYFKIKSNHLWRSNKRSSLVPVTDQHVYSEHSCWAGVNYWEDDNIFNILQNKARNGEIIPSHGGIDKDIDTISKLSSPIRISGAEISNIPDYLKGKELSLPKDIPIISTRLLHRVDVRKSLYVSRDEDPSYFVTVWEKKVNPSNRLSAIWDKFRTAINLTPNPAFRFAEFNKSKYRNFNLCF